MSEHFGLIIAPFVENAPPSLNFPTEGAGVGIGCPLSSGRERGRPAQPAFPKRQSITLYCLGLFVCVGAGLGFDERLEPPLFVPVPPGVVVLLSALPPVVLPPPFENC
jgi:hypothetical protein